VYTCKKHSFQPENFNQNGTIGFHDQHQFLVEHGTTVANEPDHLVMGELRDVMLVDHQHLVALVQAGQAKVRLAALDHLADNDRMVQVNTALKIEPKPGWVELPEVQVHFWTSNWLIEIDKY